MTVSADYKEALQELHEHSEWGVTGAGYAGESIVKLLQDNPEIRTILDYGCGEGTLKAYVEEQGITDREWTLYDPGMKAHAKKPEGQFDLVITTDVLEHVEVFMEKAVLQELKAYTKKYLYSDIACYLTRVKFESGPYIGQDLHINLKAPDAWRESLKKLEMTDVLSVATVIDGWKVRYLSVLRK